MVGLKKISDGIAAFVLILAFLAYFSKKDYDNSTLVWGIHVMKNILPEIILVCLFVLSLI